MYSMEKFHAIGNFQARAPSPIPMTQEAFEKIDYTAAYWLTAAGIFVNSRGTTVMVDPSISVRCFDPPISEAWEASREIIPLYVMPPIFARDVKQLDAVLLTHADPDHMGYKTTMELLPSGAAYHCTAYTGKKLQELGVPEARIVTHPEKDRFRIGNIDVEMTPARHGWQQDRPNEDYVYKDEDCCGFKLRTPDGVIWHPGDSELLDEHFKNEDVDLLFIDMNEFKPYHFGTENAILLANTLRQADLIMFHWGTHYSPDYPWYTGDPDKVRDRIADKERFLEPHPGEKVILRRKAKRP